MKRGVIMGEPVISELRVAALEALELAGVFPLDENGWDMTVAAISKTVFEEKGGKLVASTFGISLKEVQERCESVLMELAQRRGLSGIEWHTLPQKQRKLSFFSGSNNNGNGHKKLPQEKTSKVAFPAFIQPEFWSGKKTFEEFVPCNGGRVSWRNCLDFPQSDEKTLTIIATTGMGKTHLFESMVAECLNQGKKVIFMQASAFANMLVRIFFLKKNGLVERFRQICIEADLLVLDDMQNLSGRSFRILQVLMEIMEASLKTKFAFASTLPIEKLGFKDEVVGRIIGGWVSRVSSYSPLDKQNILRSMVKIMAQNMGKEKILEVPEDVIEALSKRDSLYGIRALKSALRNVVRTSEVMGQPVSSKIMALALNGITPFSPDEPLSNSRAIMEEVMGIVSEHFRVGVAEILSKSRKSKEIIPRKIFTYLTRNDFGFTFVEIGRFLNLDKATVMNAVKGVKSDKTLLREAIALEVKLRDKGILR